MPTELLLDTGPLVALLDPDQDRHADCCRFFEAWTGEVVSTEAVLTEATHLLGRIPGGRRACVDFFAHGGAVMIPASTQSLRRTAELLAQYADQPMDYADATLVTLAESLGTNMIFTLDGDFHVYRIGGRKAFHIVP